MFFAFDMDELGMMIVHQVFVVFEQKIWMFGSEVLDFWTEFLDFWTECLEFWIRILELIAVRFFQKPRLHSPCGGVRFG